jgi:hypothetical protein
MCKLKYLLSLNPHAKQDGKVWLPDLSQEKLEEASRNESPIVIGHTCFKHGEHLCGLYALSEDGLIRLQDHSDAAICNKHAELYSHKDTNEHQGLLGVLLKKKVSHFSLCCGSACADKEVATIFFESSCADTFKRKCMIYARRLLEESGLGHMELKSVDDQILSLCPEDYIAMYSFLPVQLR